MKHVILFTVLFFVSSSYAQKCKDTPELNQQIVALTKQKVKKKVGRGECWDLAQYVLDETNAEWDNFEVYGRLIKTKKECIYPGDIIQFEKVKLKWEDGKYSYQESMMHHTAIVVEVINQRELKIAHQNTAEFGKKVGVSTLILDRIVSGKLLIYRPVKGA